MSVEIRKQLRSGYRAMDDAQESVDWAEIAARLDSDTSTVLTPRQPVRRGLWVAAAAVVITILLVGVIPLLVRNEETPPANTVFPTTLAESAPTTAAQETTPPSTTISQEPVEGVVMPLRQGGEVTWTEEQWSELDGPRVFDVEAASGVLLGVGGGVLWSSEDGGTWERILTDLTDVSFAVDGPVVVVAGTQADGTGALFVSDDGEAWSEVENSTLLEAGGLEVVETTRSGLTLFYNRTIQRDDDGLLERVSGDGILATIADGQLIDVHTPPMDTNRSGTLVELVETSNGIVGFASNFNSPRFSYAWSYEGAGEWSQPVEIPISIEHERVGDTILMVDHTSSTCCANPILGETFWPVLVSNDGINWAELLSIAGSTTYPPVDGGDVGIHTLHILAGGSFWVYGSQIRGGGGGIEIDESTTLWISTNGTDWHSLDVPFSPSQDDSTAFVRASGDFIFIFYADGPIWIGKVEIG